MALSGLNKADEKGELNMAFANNFHILSRNGRGQSQMIYAHEASGQTFKSGQLVYLDSSGDITVCGDAATVILGIAQEDATGATTHWMYVEQIEPGDILSCRYMDSAPTLGQRYGIELDPTSYSGTTQLDQSNTTQLAFTVLEILDTTAHTCRVKPAFSCNTTPTVMFQLA
jgi:hypothetical protein